VWDYHLFSPYMLMFAFGWAMCCATELSCRLIVPKMLGVAAAVWVGILLLTELPTAGVFTVFHAIRPILQTGASRKTAIWPAYRKAPPVCGSRRRHPPIINRYRGDAGAFAWRTKPPRPLLAPGSNPSAPDKYVPERLRSWCRETGLADL
jgi:hypothetical protein